MTVLEIIHLCVDMQISIYSFVQLSLRLHSTSKSRTNYSLSSTSPHEFFTLPSSTLALLQHTKYAGLSRSSSWSFASQKARSHFI